MQKFYSLLFFSFVFLSILLSGCGAKRPDGMPETYPVTILVKVDGVPLEGAEVSAYPQNKDKAQWFGYGRSTNAEGKVKMLSSEINGLVASEFVLTIKKNVIKHDDSANAAGGETSGEYYECFVDTSYWRPVTSPLKITVDPAGQNEFEFDLKGFDPKTFDEGKWAMKIKK